MKQVKISCEGAALLDIDQMEPFQGSLKELSKAAYNRLRKSIEDYGFSFPVFIWKNENRFWTLDGHQRQSTLKVMRDEGWEVPPLPVDWIHALDAKEAHLKLLLAVSNYGKVTDEGLYEYLAISELSLDSLKSVVDLPEIDFEKFEKGYAPEPQTEEAPDPQLEMAKELIKKYGVVDGAVFELGENRIVCGDCTDINTVDKTVREGGGEKCIVLDRPTLECRVWFQFASELEESANSERQHGRKLCFLRGEILRCDKIDIS
jgi:hypothetical protein